MKRNAMVFALILIASSVSQVAAQGWPFADIWRDVVLTWNYKNRDIVCHGKSATFTGEEKKSPSTAPNGPIYRSLTYDCKVNHHEIRVWMDTDSYRLREIVCHGKPSLDQGYNSKHHGREMFCTEHKNNHNFYVIGAKPPDQ